MAHYPKTVSRLISTKHFDDPNDKVFMGSNEESDLLMEWNRVELVETIQQLDRKCFNLEKQVKELEEYKSKYEGLCK